MKSITLFTDPHLGTDRQAHTTRESAKRLRQALFVQAMDVVYNAPHDTFCLGDLFDKANNDEATLLQGYEVANRCRMTLSGNHDELNREGSVTSLQALAEMGVAVCAAPDISTPYFDNMGAIYMVPHHASQELFEQAIQDAAAHAAETRDGLASYLMLHCNYDFTLAIEDNTLNLSREFAEEIGDAFDFIFIGHEHNSSTHMGGKIRVLGNTHPTSFHDVGDKFIYHLDLETAELTEELIWSKAGRYRELKLGDPIPNLMGVQFIDVRGAGSVEDAAAVSKYINDLWKASELNGASELLAVRNKVDIKDSLDGVDIEIEGITTEDLKTRITRELEGTELAELFKELAAEAAQ